MTERTETETEFWRDGEWVPHVLIHYGEKPTRWRHRIVTITTTASAWKNGRRL